MIWALQDTRNVTDVSCRAVEVGKALNLKQVAKTYTPFVNALVRYRQIFTDRLRQQFQALAEQVGGRFWRVNSWALKALDGSRATTPRTASDEGEFGAANNGRGKTAKYRKKKSEGPRRRELDRAEVQTHFPFVVRGAH